MTATSKLIERLISYAWNDWVVTDQKSRRVVVALKTDPNIDATINDLDTADALTKLYSRVSDPGLLCQVVAVSTTASATTRRRMLDMAAYNPVLTQSSHWSGFSPDTFFDICHDLGAASLGQGFASRVSVPISPG